LVHIQEVEGSSPPPTTTRHMPNKTLTIEQVLSLLVETPRRIGALTADLSPAQLQTTPARDEWSANDVLAHLRACADVWGNCMVTMIGHTSSRSHASSTSFAGRWDAAGLVDLRALSCSAAAVRP